jgi:hypothetical protein
LMVYPPWLLPSVWHCPFDLLRSLDR